MTQKYVIIHFIDPATVPQTFQAVDWPLHITLLSNFTVPGDLHAFMQDIADFASTTKQFKAVATKDAAFGAHGTIPVTLMASTPAFATIHTGLATIATKHAAIFDEPHYLHDGYRPHATIRPTARLHQGQSVLIGDFTLVDMFPDADGNKRRIISTYRLMK